MPRLLAILGHTNDGNAVLSGSARARCIAAASYFQSTPVAYLIATGAYGTNFNPAAIPHGELILREVRRIAGTTPISLGHTVSAYTEEDLYQIRRAYADKECDGLTIVTSRFHADRVTRMARLIFRDIVVDFVFADDGSEITADDRRAERDRMAAFEASWVDAPLYTRNAPFPTEIYQNAMEQHKHSDSLSLAIVTGALIFGGYPHTKLSYATAGPDGAVLLVICGAIALVLMMLYLRFAAFAFLARCTLRALELGWQRPGFSYNNDRFFAARWPWRRRVRTTQVLAGLAIIVAAVNFLAAIAILRS